MGALVFTFPNPWKIKFPNHALMAAIARLPGPVKRPKVRRQQHRRNSAWEMSFLLSVPEWVARIQADKHHLQNAQHEREKKSHLTRELKCIVWK